MIVNIHAAKTNLSKLIEKAEAGEEVVIARNGKPAVRLTPVAERQAHARRYGGRRTTVLVRLVGGSDLDLAGYR
jgi:prevent-host-death family protein